MFIGYLVSCLVLLLGVLFLSWGTRKWLVELMGTKVAAVVLWPGVVVHELSHLLGAVLTFTRVTGVALLPKGNALGSVSHVLPRNPLVLILISLFPILGASFILWLLAQLLLPIAPAVGPVPVFTGGWIASAAAYLNAWWEFMRAFWQAFSIQTWQSWFFAYLAICIAAHLAPSSTDFGHAAAGFTAVSLVAVAVVWGADLININLGERLARWTIEAVQFFIPLLAYSFALLLAAALLAVAALGIKRLNSRVDWW